MFVHLSTFPSLEIHDMGVVCTCPGQGLSKPDYMTVFGAAFIEIYTDWFSESNFPFRT